MRGCANRRAEELLASQLFAKKSIDKLIADSEQPENRLKRTLGPVALTSLGIGAVIGSGIFTVVGTAIAGQTLQVESIWHAPLLEYLISQSAAIGRPGAGPAIILSFLLVAVACGFAALCYAEMASRIPIAGSAYTYTYATMGELAAWVIGWNLILEYAVSNMAVSVGFSAHLANLLDYFGLHLPAQWSYPAYLPAGLTDEGGAVLFAPGWHFGFNVPAFLVVMILTVILVRGIRESAEANNFMVLLKVGAILLFVFAAAQFVQPANYRPFAPNGFPGILTGGAIIFFTYIGFDSVSTAAEEAKNPRRDIPIGIIATLLICTVLYIAVAAVLTGIRYWNTMEGDAAPVVNALTQLNLGWVRLAVLFGAIMGMVSSLLVFQLGQARVWFAMSRDGLMPRKFGHVHARFRTPSTSTWIAGWLVGIGAGLLDIGTVAELSNIGTLFAFVLVAVAVLILRRRDPSREGYRAPFGALAPVGTIITCSLLMAGLPLASWARFVIWLIIGLVIYAVYSRHHSEFARRA